MLDRGASGQARELAEGQKSADVQHRCRGSTPSASQLELAEWVQFPEKNAVFVILRTPFGGGGAAGLLVRECPRAWPCLTDRTVILRSQAGKPARIASGSTRKISSRLSAKN